MTLRTVLAVVFLTGSALAQVPAQPGPEVKKLDYFVGTWTAEGTIPPGPWGAGGRFSVTHAHEWMVGNFFLESHSDMKLPPDLGGESKSISFMGYDADKKVYTETEFTSQGGSGVSQGTLNGDTWTWTWTEKLPNGQVIQHRDTNKMLSPTTYRGKDEVSGDGIKWLVIMESTVTKK